MKGRKNSIELEKTNEQLLNELDSLKKRMGQLEKSSSCGALITQKTVPSQKQETKSSINLKKFTTEEGKSILKKKGRPVGVKTRVK